MEYDYGSSVAKKSAMEDIARHFANSTGVGVSIIDGRGQPIFTAGRTCASCAFCKDRTECEMSLLYGSFQSLRFGGRYVFFCRSGFTHFASPVTSRGIMLYAFVGGPFLMIDKDDFLASELESFDLAKPDGTDESGSAHILDEMTYVSPERVHSLSELLFICTERLSIDKDSRLSAAHESQQLQGVISEYIMQIKNKNDGTGGQGFYPLQKEDELLDAMSTGDVKAAKALLNELLGHIFFYSGFRFDVIRSRILELIVLLSRAAVKGGADAELIFGLNYEYIRDLDNFKTTEDLAYWLSIVMNRFTDYVFNFVGVKHADVIYKAVDYMKLHYMEKLTLEEVAGYVYLSAPYFSKVFKDETKTNFNHYLNKIRIEHSKKLLLNQNIPLADVSNLVGYEDQSYYSKVFKKITGLSPLKYRQSRGGAS
ncbi:MAG: PocR ligand-binding domain-containing protein [Defluviitaleaceae bacterium]|nr:PocR ligand-binding domain-containing protein [Defluviitaleaceae bacterium]